MKWLKRAFLVGMALVLALIAVLIFSLRSSRNQFDPPTELKAGIFEIRVKAARAHVLAARVGSRILLFDSGPDPSGKGLDALLGSMGAARADVTDIFITHGHWDHAQL